MAEAKISSSSMLDKLFEAFQVTSDGNYVYVCDVKRDYSRWAKQAVDYFDLPSEYMHKAGEVWASLIHPDDRGAYLEDIDAVMSGRKQSHDLQYRVAGKDGSYVVVSCHGVVITDDDGEPAYFTGTIRNYGIQSSYDAVTGLKNLYGFFNDLKGLRLSQIPSTVILIGITHFAEINDMHGYSVGNAVLQRVSEMIQDVFGHDGTVYRMEGAKFSVISESLDFKGMMSRYNTLSTAAKSGIKISGTTLNLFMAAGFVEVSDFSVNSHTIYTCLKFAYYESKGKRQGELAEFANKISDDNRQLLEQLNVIRSCVVDNCKGFFLCYQPIISVGTEKLVGMEALVRWQDDKYGVVSPNDFIPVLEKDMVFPELGYWILRQALVDSKEFVAKNPKFVVNVNLSYSQIERSDFLDRVIRVIRDTDYPPANLCLEITERCRLLDEDMLKNKIIALKAQGVRFAIDDFGTGFSSVNLLRKMPVDVVKIDREFVRNIMADQMDQLIVQAVASMATQSGRDICVEGVETEEVRDFLKQYPVSCFQGYLYSRPIRIDEFRTFAEKYL